MTEFASGTLCKQKEKWLLHIRWEHAMRVAGILLLIFIDFLTNAQKFYSAAKEFGSEYWHDGMIVLDNSDTVKGSLKYDLAVDIIQFKELETVESFTPRKLTSFEIFDQLVKKYRQFYSIPYTNSTTSDGYKALMFFELLAQGKLTLLCRESIEEVALYGVYGASASKRVLVYTYFLLQENGSIEQVVGDRADLLRLMGDHGSQVKKYAKSNHLHLNDRNEFIQIIAYYNSLQ